MGYGTCFWKYVSCVSTCISCTKGVSIPQAHDHERIIAREQLYSVRCADLHNLFDTKAVTAPVLPFSSIQPLCVDDSPLPARATSVYPEAVPASTGKLPRIDAAVWIDAPTIPLTGDTESASVLGINGSTFVPRNQRVFLA